MDTRFSPTAADCIAMRLAEAGCRHAFGMPGGEVLSLVRALERAGIAFVLAKHETAAGFMAEAAWHATGAPGVLVATIGPGAMNAVNAVANADQDRVPLIVLTGCVEADEAETYTHQVLDHGAVFAPITKGTFKVSAGAADIVADKAVRLALEGRPGPVHIDLPIGTADTGLGRARRASLPPALPAMPAPGPDWDVARGWFAGAARPLAIIGLDVMVQGAGSAVQAVLERHGIPFLTTYKTKGVIAEDHPLCLGAAGLSPLADGHLLPLVRAADLILCLGYDPIEMRTGWRAVWDAAEQHVIDIAAAPNRHFMHGAGVNVIGAVGPSLAALAEAAPVRGVWAGQEPAAVQSALARAFPTDDAWGPGAVIDECRRALPPETIATVDSGAHRILLSQMWRCTGPRSLLQSSGLCTMGCALPLAIGAAAMNPGRAVVGFMGDAGFLMTTGELATAAEMKLPVIFVVFVDQSLALIEKKQRERQMPNEGVDFGWHDYAAIGRAFGGHGHRVTSRSELRTALEAALTADRFTVIAAEIERKAYDGRI